MSKKKIYISLPITGQDFEEVEARSIFTSVIIEEVGFEAVSPLEVSDNQDAPYEEHIGKDITALLRCDAVLFLEGWQESKGCNLEHDAARIYGKMMFFSLDEIVRYKDENGIY